MDLLPISLIVRGAYLISRNFEGDTDDKLQKVVTPKQGICQIYFAGIKVNSLNTVVVLATEGFLSEG